MGADGIQKMLGSVGIKADGAKTQGNKRRRNPNATENTEPKEAHIAYPVFDGIYLSLTYIYIFLYLNLVIYIYIHIQARICIYVSYIFIYIYIYVHKKK